MLLPSIAMACAITATPSRRVSPPTGIPTIRAKRYFALLFQNIRESGKGRQFDSIIGLSGGLDSSYMLHLAVTEFGMRPLVFHVDGGWNTDIAVNNIQVLVDKLNLDLYTEVINWEEMRDFQLAYFKSGVPHSIFAGSCVCCDVVSFRAQA